MGLDDRNHVTLRSSARGAQRGRYFGGAVGVIVEIETPFHSPVGVNLRSTPSKIEGASKI